MGFKIGLFCVKHLIKRRKEADYSILVLTPLARSVCILYNVQNILPYMPVAQPQKKILLGRIFFSLFVYSLVYMEKTNILLKKMNAKKLYSRVQQKNNETFRKFSLNQEVAAMQVEL